MRHSRLRVVDGDPPPVTPAESDEVHVVVVPVAYAAVPYVVVPLHHVRDTLGPVDARPAIAAGGVGDEAVGVRRWGVVAGLELKGRVDLWPTVVVGQQELVRQEVGGAILVVERRAVTLRVVVLGENESLVCR